MVGMEVGTELEGMEVVVVVALSEGVGEWVDED